MKTSRSLQIATFATTVVSSLSASVSVPAYASHIEERDTTSIVQVAHERLTLTAAADSGSSSDRSPVPGDSRR